ncbi:MAG: ABC transporter permease [Austwickia sp.]|jgi:ABC-2 type transport system permease protein|nr:MAG: ABC transporter permease [Austwickia sp.]
MSTPDTVATGAPASGRGPERAPTGAAVAGTARPRLSPWRLLGSELALIAGRRRNQAGLAVLASVPIIMAIAVKVSQPRAGRGPDFLSSITANGLFVAFAALTVEMTMFLPLAIAMVSGDSVAGEANIGTLRYLLTVPVGRTRLLVVKYLSLVVAAVWAVTLVAVVGAIVGIVMFGTGPLTSLSGSQLPFSTAVVRLILVVLYLGAGLAALAAVGLFISTLTEQPMAAAVALMIVTIVSWILDAIPQVDWLAPYLIVHEWLAFGDLLRDPIATEAIGRGLLVDLCYAIFFWALAWARFAGKDITS